MKIARFKTSDGKTSYGIIEDEKLKVINNIEIGRASCRERV